VLGTPPEDCGPSAPLFLGMDALVELEALAAGSSSERPSSAVHMKGEIFDGDFGSQGAAGVAELELTPSKGTKRVLKELPIIRKPEQKRAKSEFLISPKAEVCDEEGSIACPGCHRSRTTGVCFLTGACPTPWALPDRKGAWCRDCFNCWRLTYQSKCTLVLFGMWLRSAKNYCEWETRLVAFLSLKSENIERVSEAMILIRVRSIDFALKMMCANPGPCEVRPLEAALATITNFEASRLIVMTKPGSDGNYAKCVGYLVDTTPSKADLIGRPADGSWLGWHRQAALATDDSSRDMDFLKQAFGDESVSLVTSTPGSTATPAQNQIAAAKHQSTAEKKGNSILSWALSHLESWSSPEWTKIKEATFTSTLTKLASSKTEAAITEGDEADIVKSLNRCSAALSHGKLFSKKHREFVKSPKVSKLASISPHAEEFVQFLLDEKIKVHQSLLLFRMKVAFSKDAPAGDMVLWSKRFKEMLLMDLKVSRVEQNTA